MIALTYADGFVRAVLCSNPDPSTAANILGKYYRGEDAIKRLFACGDLITLHRLPPLEKDKEDAEHSHRVTVPASAEGGEPHVFRNEEQLALEGGKLLPADYAFLWRGDAWYVAYLREGFKAPDWQRLA